MTTNIIGIENRLRRATVPLTIERLLENLPPVYDDSLSIRKNVLWSIGMYTNVMDLTKSFMSKRVSNTRNWKYQRNSIAKKRPSL